MCSSLSWGGLEMNVLRFCEWLQNEGYTTSLWCVADSPLEQAARKRPVAVHLIQHHRKYLDFRAAYRLSKQMSTASVDVIWIRDTRDISVCGLAKRFAPNRFKLVYQQAMQIGVNKRDIAHTMRFSQIDRWIAPLNYLAEQVQTKTRFPHDRIRVIPLAVDVERFTQLPAKASARHSLEIDIPNDGVLITNVGRIDPLKGQDFLLSAFFSLRKQGLPVYLLLMGDPTRNEGREYLDQLQGRVERSGEESRVFFRPHRPDVEIAYASTDVFAMVSAGETFGMVTIEALVSGCAVIGTNTSGTPELLGNGSHGVLFPPDDIEAFLAGIVPLIEDSSLRGSLCASGQLFAANRFNKATVVQQLSDLVNTL